MKEITETQIDMSGITESTPLLSRSESDSANDVITKPSNKYHNLLKFTEAFNTLFTVMGLSNQFIYQVLSVLKDNNVEIDADTLKLINQVSPILPVMLTTAAITYNRLRESRAGHYPAAQDKVRATFSGSLLMMIYSFYTSGKDLSDTLAGFISTMIATPILSIGLGAIATSDTTLPPKHADFQAIEAANAANPASIGRNLYNAFSATTEYGLNFPVIFWLINREIEGKTVDMSTSERYASLGCLTVTAIIGLTSASNPTLLNYIAKLSKSTRDAALTYGAMSGLVYLLLDAFKEDPNDLSDSARAGLITFCTFSSLVSLVHGVITTNINFDAQTESYNKITGFLSKTKGFLYNLITCGFKTTSNSTEEETMSLTEVITHDEVDEFFDCEEEIEVTANDSSVESDNDDVPDWISNDDSDDDFFDCEEEPEALPEHRLRFS
jgi:hypothetical protein